MTEPRNDWKALSRPDRGNRLRAAAEKWWPPAIGVAVGVFLLFLNPPTDRTSAALDRALQGGLGAASILAGFQITALTLMLSIADKPIVKGLRKLGFYDRLIIYHRESILLLLAWLVVSLVLMVVQGGTLDANGQVTDHGRFTRWAAIFVALIASSAVAACIRVTCLMIKLLRSVANERDECA